MNSEFLKIMDDIYGKKESPSICDSLCDKVKAAILGGNDYHAYKKEEVHDIIKGDKKDEE